MPRPNILLFTTDQHNAEIMGCAGNPVVQTPHLDELAANGVLFTNAFTPHPVCTPARTSLFTGQYARRHGAPNNINLRSDVAPPRPQNQLPAEAVAFPAVLARHGYRTSLFGKLHTEQAGGKDFGLQLMRLAEGKGQFIRYGAPPDDYRQYLKAKGYDDAAGRTWELPTYAGDGWVTSPLREEDYIDTWTATEAVKHLEQVEEPFFSWVSFSGPHTPWDPPEPYASMYAPEDVRFPARRPGELEEKHPHWVESLARTIPATPPTSTGASLPVGLKQAYDRFSNDQVRAMIAAYYAEISLIDAQVGRLLATLKRRGLYGNTLVIFTADHGDYLGNNWAFFKYGAPYDSLARIPLVMSGPGFACHGGRHDELVSLVDLAPTMLTAAGVQSVDPFDGRPLQPLVAGDCRDWRGDIPVFAGNVNGLMTPEWRYLRWHDGFEELYDRLADPHDLHNLAGRPEQRQVCAEMATLLARA